MDLWDLTRLLLRRWYFAVPMLLASVAIVVLAAKTVSPDYKSVGYVQLIPAPSTGKIPDPKAKPRPANPWLDLGYSALGNAAALSVTDQVTLDRLTKEGYTDSVTVVLNQQTPLFEIEAVGNSPAQATGTVREIIKLLQTDIATKQKQYNAEAQDTITTLVINDGSTPSEESGKVKRVLIVAAGLGVLLTTAATIALDYWLRRRANRRAGDDRRHGSGGGDDGRGRADEVAAAGPVSPSSFGLTPLVTASARLQHDPGEKTRRLLPQPTPTAKPSNDSGGGSNGKVYSSDRQKSDASARASSGPANSLSDPPDATVVLPTPHPARRSSDTPGRRSQDKRR